MPDNILGFYPWAFILIFCVGLPGIGGLIFWLLHKRKRAAVSIEESTGKLLCEFCSPEGITEILCEVWKGQLKKIEDKNRGTFLVRNFVKSPESIDKSIDLYWVLQDHMFPVRYPAGKPFDEQTVVMKTHYLVGDPMPRITYRPDRYNDQVYNRITSALGKMAQDEKNMQVLTTWLSGMRDQIENFMVYIRRIPIIFIGIGLVLLLQLINMLISNNTTSAVKSIATHFGIGG